MKDSKGEFQLNLDALNSSKSNCAALKLGNQQLPNYIAVEGPIGVGKSSLAKRLAESFGYGTVLEKPEKNPFLERFFQNPTAAALPTQLYFLFQRSKQLKDLCQSDIFQPAMVADFILEKDPLFAEATLDKDELALYQAVYQQMTLVTPKPDLVIYLQAPTEVLEQRLSTASSRSQRRFDFNYLNRLNEAYTRFFYYYDAAPLLIVNAAEINPVDNSVDLSNLVMHIKQVKSGRHYYNPQPDS